MSNCYYFLAGDKKYCTESIRIQNDMLLECLIKNCSFMPNAELPTMGGNTFWINVLEGNELRLQVNKVFGNARILNKNNVRLAWGSFQNMKDKLEQIKTTLQNNDTSVLNSAIVKYSDKLKAGDVIGIKRSLGYEHYAVYMGNDRVIHFAGENGEINSPTIHEAPISEFLDGQDDPFVLAFAEVDQVFSPEDTISRAKSVTGANEYNFNKKYHVAFNNCEHFAIWCKTGRHESRQVDEVINNAASVPIFAVAAGTALTLMNTTALLKALYEIGKITYDL